MITSDVGMVVNSVVLGSVTVFISSDVLVFFVASSFSDFAKDCKTCYTVLP